jgi:hypothetical protein
VTTSTTGVRPPTESKASASALGPSEPEILVRERAVLRQVLALVADRADVEAKVHGTRTSGDSKADSEYAKARQGLAEKLERLNREAVAEDERQRRAIVNKAIEAEATAKAEFAAASRKIATMFDAARDAAKSDYAAGKSEAATSHDASQ